MKPDGTLTPIDAYMAVLLGGAVGCTLALVLMGYFITHGGFCITNKATSLRTCIATTSEKVNQ